MLALSQLEVVEGDLRIWATRLSDIDFFSSLSEVGGELRIEENRLLSVIEGPPQLVEVGEAVTIVNNDSLIAIDGFEELRSVGGFDVKENRELRAITGPANLETLDGDLRIADTSWLETLEGLRGLVRVRGSVELGGCNGDWGSLYTLSSLSGLRNLQTIDGDLRLICPEGPHSLESLESLGWIGGDLIVQGNSLYSTHGLWELAFPNLRSIGGGVSITSLDSIPNLGGLQWVDELEYLHVERMAALESLAGLSSDLRVGDLTIRNTSLEQSQVDEFVASVEVTGEVVTCGNSPDLSQWC